MAIFILIMKKSLTILLCLLICVFARAQSRIYVSAGLTSSRGDHNTLIFSNESGGYGFFEVEWERKMLGSFHSLIGLSYFKTGYFREEDFLGSMSRFRGNYLAMPLMVRFNVGNKNNFYIDAGPCPYFMLKATLEEGETQFGEFRTFKANITPYSIRLFLGFRVQFTLAVNRFTISGFVLSGDGNSSVKDLHDHWALNRQESTYLLARGYSNFSMIGWKFGVRIK